MLTPRQRDLMLILQDYYDEHKVMPTLQEMADLLGVVSKSRVHSLLVGLQERGYIVRLLNRARAIKILERAD